MVVLSTSEHDTQTSQSGSWTDHSEPQPDSWRAAGGKGRGGTDCVAYPMTASPSSSAGFPRRSPLSKPGGHAAFVHHSTSQESPASPAPSVAIAGFDGDAFFINPASLPRNSARHISRRQKVWHPATTDTSSSSAAKDSGAKATAVSGGPLPQSVQVKDSITPYRKKKSLTNRKSGPAVSSNAAAATFNSANASDAASGSPNLAAARRNVQVEAGTGSSNLGWMLPMPPSSVMRSRSVRIEGDQFHFECAHFSIQRVVPYWCGDTGGASGGVKLVLGRNGELPQSCSGVSNYLEEGADGSDQGGKKLILRESLHGHSYRVALQLERSGGEDGAGANPLEVRAVKHELKKICKDWTDRFILPLKSPLLDIELISKELSNGQARFHYRVATYDGDEYVFPQADCLPLPVKQTSVEDLCEFLWFQLKDRLEAKMQGIFSEMEVVLTAGPHASATYRNKLSFLSRHFRDYSAHQATNLTSAGVLLPLATAN